MNRVGNPTLRLRYITKSSLLDWSFWGILLWKRIADCSIRSRRDRPDFYITCHQGVIDCSLRNSQRSSEWSMKRMPAMTTRSETGSINEFPPTTHPPRKYGKYLRPLFATNDTVEFWMPSHERLRPKQRPSWTALILTAATFRRGFRYSKSSCYLGDCTWQGGNFWHTCRWHSSQPSFRKSGKCGLAFRYHRKQFEGKDPVAVACIHACRKDRNPRICPTFTKYRLRQKRRKRLKREIWFKAHAVSNSIWDLIYRNRSVSSKNQYLLQLGWGREHSPPARN